MLIAGLSRARFSAAIKLRLLNSNKFLSGDAANNTSDREKGGKRERDRSERGQIRGKLECAYSEER